MEPEESRSSSSSNGLAKQFDRIKSALRRNKIAVGSRLKSRTDDASVKAAPEVDGRQHLSQQEADNTMVVVAPQSRSSTPAITTAPQDSHEEPQAQLVKDCASNQATITVAPIDTIEADSEEDLGEDMLLPLPYCLPSARSQRRQESSAKHPSVGFSGSATSHHHPNKKVRVEKTVRMRVHWICHQCSTAFGASETICNACGHGRCQGCSRQPPQRIQKIIDDAKISYQRAKREALIHTNAAHHQRNDSAAAGDSPPIAQATEALQPEQEDEGIVADTATPSMLHLPPRPRSAASLLHKSTALVASSPWAVGLRGSEDTEHESAEPVIPQRVMMKPRVRVYYICDRCEAIFANTNTCNGCGHHRCTNCTRRPPKKSHPQPPSDLVLELEASLSSRRTPTQYPSSSHLS